MVEYALPGNVRVTLDGCMHWLVGSSPGNNFYRFWEELGAVQDRRMIYHEEYARVEVMEAKVFILYTDLGRLEQYMKELALRIKMSSQSSSKGHALALALTCQ